MKSSLFSSNWRFPFLARGERGIAFLGIALALILVDCFAANAWLTDRANKEAAANQTVTTLKAIGPLLSERSQRLIAAGDLAGLRRLMSSSAASLKLDACTVWIGAGSVLADMTPSRVNTFVIPDHWTVDESQDSAADGNGGTHLRFPFFVPGKGAGILELGKSLSTPRDDFNFGSSASVCAIGLCLLVFVYRRSRRGLAEMDIVGSSLRAMARGETSLTALMVDAHLGPVAAAWNKLLGDIEDLRRRGTASPAVNTIGNRRGVGNNLEAACDAMSQGLILVDDKMRVRFSNGAACTFLKLDRSALAGIAAADLVQDVKFHDAIVSIAGGKLRRPVTVELEQPGESGNGVLRFCVRPVRRGDADSAMVIIEDITQQRTAERARNAFITQVTHELRTPLTNIRLYAETAIEDGEKNPQVRANCLNVINQESRRLERIVSEMLSVAEIEAGCSTMNRDEVYIDVLIADLHADYRAQAEEKRISLEFVLAPKLPKLLADKDKLAIALHNLIGNALKYTPEGGKVTVAVDSRDGNAGNRCGRHWHRHQTRGIGEDLRPVLPFIGPAGRKNRRQRAWPYSGARGHAAAWRRHDRAVRDQPRQHLHRNRAPRPNAAA